MIRILMFRHSYLIVVDVKKDLVRILSQERFPVAAGIRIIIISFDMSS